MNEETETVFTPLLYIETLSEENSLPRQEGIRHTNLEKKGNRMRTNMQLHGLKGNIILKKNDFPENRLSEIPS